MDYNEKLRQQSFQRHLDELLEEGDTEQLHKAATMLNEARGSSATAGGYAATNRRAEPPEERGWYWIKMDETANWEVVEVFEDCDGKMKAQTNRGSVFDLHDSRTVSPKWWVGPIEKPTPEGEAEGAA